MRRQEEPRRVEGLLARLRGLSTPSEHDLRAMARAATSRSRPLPAPIASRGGLSARGIGVVALALAAAVALGVGLGTLLAPTGTAASGAVGTGFLPQPGWTVLQSGADATAERQSLAVATNVRLHPEDDARGIRASSGLPYATLLRLPPEGIVIVVLFTVREPYAWMDEEFPERELPLRVRDAIAPVLYSVPVRPDRPLGQYQLRARANGHYIDVHFYFGTRRPSPELRAVAQRQLDRLVVGSVSAGGESATRSPTAARGASKVIDRTVVCTIGTDNPREIDVEAQSGVRLFGDRTKWRTRPNASFSDPRSGPPNVDGGILAGWPPVQPDMGQPVFTEGLSYSTRCHPSDSRVPLSTAGLSGGAASQFGEEYDCVVPAKIVLRIRSVFYAPASIRRQRTKHTDRLVAHGRVREGALAIRTQSGRPIALATVHESGRARLLVGDSCGPNA